ncbi:MAG: C40 family peptidase, partial [Magnetococcales bacterium]|nr:C40 family peptidase [Magnetococcales bacterium]
AEGSTGSTITDIGPARSGSVEAATQTPRSPDSAEKSKPDPATGKFRIPITDKQAERFADGSKELIGTPYGLLGPKSAKGVGVDCSGAPYLAAKIAGLEYDYSQAKYLEFNPHLVKVQDGSDFKMSELKKGDFIQMKSGKDVWHVVIYDPQADPGKPGQKRDPSINVYHASRKKNKFMATALNGLTKYMKITGVFRYHQ